MFAADYLEDIEHEVGNEDAGYVFVACCEPLVENIVSYVKNIASAQYSLFIHSLPVSNFETGTVILSGKLWNLRPVRIRAEVFWLKSISP